MWTRCISIWIYLSLLYVMTITVMAGNGGGAIPPAQMTDEQLIETLTDREWHDQAFMEIYRRLRESDFDGNTALAKRLIKTWKMTDESQNEKLKGICFQALTLIKSQEVVDILCRQLLEGSTRNERKFAANSLRQLGPSEAAVRALRSAVAKDEGVSHDGRSIARASISALGFMGAMGADALMAIWASETERRGCEEDVVISMGSTKDKRCIPVLLEVLQGQRVDLRDGAALALGEMGDDSALPILRKYEKDPDVRVRENVVEAIEKIQKSVAASKEAIDAETGAKPQ